MQNGHKKRPVRICYKIRRQKLFQNDAMGIQNT